MIKQKQLAKEKRKQEELKKKVSQLVPFPNKFIDPITFYRIIGDIAFYPKPSAFIQDSQSQFCLSVYRCFKAVSNIEIDRKNEMVTLNYNHLDFSYTPWQLIVDRYKSLGDKDIYHTATLIHQYCEELQQQVMEQPQSHARIQNILQNQQLSGELSINNDEKSKSFYILKLTNNQKLKQIYTTAVSISFQLLKEMNTSVNDYVKFCLKQGMPEYKFFFLKLLLSQSYSISPTQSHVDYFNQLHLFVKNLNNKDKINSKYSLYPPATNKRRDYKIEVDRIDFQQTDDISHQSFKINYIFQDEHFINSNAVQYKKCPKIIEKKGIIQEFYDESNSILIDKQCSYKQVNTRIEA